jgi:glycosyltransferase involved in cell wall biosynthesis
MSNIISVLTLTYQRHQLLEEAIQSFLLQDYEGDSEMVIINDCPDVEYHYTHPKIKIINLKERFSSVGKKLEYGLYQCKGDYIYRLDDDDLLPPWALSLTESYIVENPGHDIYRSQKDYFFVNNKFESISDNVNSGNTFCKTSLPKIKVPDCSWGEDQGILFRQNLKVCTINVDRCTMIYRWGMNTYHISGMGDRPTKEIYEWTDKIVKKENGIIILNPHFDNDYFSQIIK